jgi:hypothetical protein
MYNFILHADDASIKVQMDMDTCIYIQGKNAETGRYTF